MLNTKKIRKDFPIYKNNKNLVYLDSTATSLKPKVVIKKLNEYYEKYTSNIFRGLYPLSQKATKEHEETREIVAKFINAFKPEEVIFTKNTSESLNLLAYSLGEQIIKENDKIVCSITEHHSNFVPWQQLCMRKKAKFETLPVDKNGNLETDHLEKLITKKTKILALPYISNVLGILNPIKKIARKARKLNPDIIVIIDAAQAAPHLKLDVEDLKVDFLAFSSHKMLGPTGVGVLWGKEKLLRAMPPFLTGGETIHEVTKEKTTFAVIPHKFEAGTPAIGEIIALKEAIKYLEKIGLERIQAHEKKLITYAVEKLKKDFGDQIKFLGPQTPENKTGILAFTFDKFHPHDIAEILGNENICVRAGSHCAMPIHKHYDILASTRASFYLYNDKKDIDRLAEGLKNVEKILSSGDFESKEKYMKIFKEPCC